MKKLVTVLSSGCIPELGNIAGPIIIPTRIRMEEIVHMVKNGRNVYEHNPSNPDESVKLNLTNVKADNFSDKQPKPTATIHVEKPTPVVETAKEEAPQEVAEEVKNEAIDQEPVVSEEKVEEVSESEEVTEDVKETPETVEEKVEPEVTKPQQNNQKQGNNKNKNKKNNAKK